MQCSEIESLKFTLWIFIVTALSRLVISIILNSYSLLKSACMIMTVDDSLNINIFDFPKIYSVYKTICWAYALLELSVNKSYYIHRQHHWYIYNCYNVHSNKINNWITGRYPQACYIMRIIDIYTSIGMVLGQRSAVGIIMDKMHNIRKELSSIIII